MGSGITTCQIVCCPLLFLVFPALVYILFFFFTREKELTEFSGQRRPIRKIKRMSLTWPLGLATLTTGGQRDTATVPESHRARTALSVLGLRARTVSAWLLTRTVRARRHGFNAGARADSATGVLF
jgi:hypothetical protein